MGDCAFGPRWDGPSGGRRHGPRVYKFCVLPPLPTFRYFFLFLQDLVYSWVFRVLVITNTLNHYINTTL
jgi:hypothetical protein